MQGVGIISVHQVCHNIPQFETWTIPVMDYSRGIYFTRYSGELFRATELFLSWFKVVVFGGDKHILEISDQVLLGGENWQTE